jgi:hypothetical protein
MVLVEELEGIVHTFFSLRDVLELERAEVVRVVLLCSNDIAFAVEVISLRGISSSRKHTIRVWELHDVINMAELG